MSGVVACASTPPSNVAPATVPIQTVSIQGAARQNAALVIMLPGIRDRAEQFLQHGFLASETRDAFDVLAVDAHWGYYADGSIVERLRDDVILPAQRRGYERIWLLGVSLGGYGSLLYAERFPEDLRGIILLAPYLGDRRLATQIREAGGLSAWSADEAAGEPFVEGWRSLQELTRLNRLTIMLGYGTADRLAATYDPLAQALPASQIYTAAGGHRWGTWLSLWTKIKEAGVVQ